MNRKSRANGCHILCSTCWDFEDLSNDEEIVKIQVFQKLWFFQITSFNFWFEPEGRIKWGRTWYWSVGEVLRVLSDD